MEQNTLKNIDIILITHEHQDHLHIDSLRVVVKNNPKATIVANSAVAALIRQEDFSTTVSTVGDGVVAEVQEIKIEGFGKDHATIYGTMGLVENTSYLVAEKFYFPGDAFHNPEKEIDVLALPIAGPWMKMSDAIDFVKELKPRVAFGVHDGMIVPSFRGFVGAALKMFAPGVEYVSLADNETKEF